MPIVIKNKNFRSRHKHLKWKVSNKVKAGVTRCGDCLQAGQTVNHVFSLFLTFDQSPSVKRTDEL